MLARNINHVYPGTLEQLIERIELTGFREMCKITGVNDEVRLLLQLADFVNGGLQGGIHVGVGGFVETDMAVADLDERETRAGALLVPRQSKYGRGGDACSHCPNQARSGPCHAL